MITIPGLKIIDEILKGLPENARHREARVQLLSEIETLQKENTKLKTELDRLKPRQRHPSDETLRVLEFLFDRGYVVPSQVAQQFQVQPSVAEFHFDVLLEHRFIQQATPAVVGEAVYELTSEGRACIMERRGAAMRPSEAEAKPAR